ncbi:protein ARV1-like [Physella acuta]|uniref:protein ARV1-like n=1 Tax=Physella acuta TaxID=109671 RepID=UPI0027DCA70E|nr:protein ARV1-like [Physella acuta]
MKKYQCIECGANVLHLYRDYKADVIKIYHCESCNAVADKYIEYDPVIILLDALLLQPQAYRHLLINSQHESEWRLVFLLWICDAFAKLVSHRADLVITQQASTPANVNYINLGLELYLNFIIAAAELCIFMAFVVLMFAVQSLWETRSLQSLSIPLLSKAVILASMGRMLVIPVLLWDQSYSYVYGLLCQGFVCLSTLQALRVVNQGQRKTFWSLLAVIFGCLSQHQISHRLHEWFD